MLFPTPTVLLVVPHVCFGSQSQMSTRTENCTRLGALIAGASAATSCRSHRIVRDERTLPDRWTR